MKNHRKDLAEIQAHCKEMIKTSEKAKARFDLGSQEAGYWRGSINSYRDILNIVNNKLDLTGNK